MDIKEIRSNLKEVKTNIESVNNSFLMLKKLIDERKTLIENVKISFRQYRGRVIEIAKRKSKDNYTPVFLNSIKLPFNKKSYDEKTVEDLYILINYINIYNRATELYKQYSDISTFNEHLNPLLKNSFSWLFTNKDVKDDAVETYNGLLDIINNGFINEVEELNRKRKTIDRSKAIQSFFDNTDLFVEVLNNAMEKVAYSEEDPETPDFRKIQNKENKLKVASMRIKEILNDYDGVRKSVIDNANLIAADESNKILSEIDVDELNRRRKGIRTSILKDAGYRTIEDIVNTRPYQLSSIYGISENNAYEIKREAERIREETSKNIKIKISADNKTDNNTKILKSLYKYTYYRDIVDVTKRIDDLYRDVADRLVRSLEKCDNELKWLQNTKHQKEEFIKLVPELNKYDNNDYVGNVEKLFEAKNLLLFEKELNKNQAWDFFDKNSAKCFSALDELVPGLFGNSDTFYGLPEELAQQIQDECFFPEGLLVTLRRYQEWGVKYILHQKKVLLGDEMGLGKTVQAIASMVSLRNTGEKHFLVICPASVVINWCREIEQHSKLRAIKFHGASRRAMLKNWIENGGVGVTTYETIGSLKIPEDFKYSMLIVDEAHYVKNPEARRTKNVIDVGKKTDRILYMTGTALENRVDEMIELISQLQPDVARQVSNLAFMSTAETFRNKVAPVYYRRKRDDVLTELPDLIENEAWCELQPQEKDIYENNVLAKKVADIRRVSWNVDDLNISSKAQRLKELLVEIKEDGRKVIVFSFFLDTIRKIYEYFNDVCLPPITGSLSPARRQEVIDDFDKAEAGAMLICQIQAGGTGLNIQSASVVVITEPQWKPSIENQAISRAYRMGQTRNVLVYRLLCVNTVDEKMINLLKEKQQIFDAFADKSAAAEANREIDEKTFGNIIKEEIDRINAEKAAKNKVEQEEDENNEEKIV